MLKCSHLWTWPQANFYVHVKISVEITLSFLRARLWKKKQNIRPMLKYFIGLYLKSSYATVSWKWYFIFVQKAIEDQKALIYATPHNNKKIKNPR